MNIPAQNNMPANRSILWVILGLITIGVIAFVIYLRMVVTDAQNANTNIVIYTEGKYCTSDGTLNDTMPIQSHRSYCLKAGDTNVAYTANTPVTYTFSIIDDQGNTLKDFAVAHEKLMHFIVVRHDLQEFQHLHPVLDATTGEFTVDITFSADGTYRLFPDFTPGQNVNPMALPVTVYTDIQVGQANGDSLIPVADTETIKTVGDYEITYNLSDTIEAGVSLPIELIISKNSEPVANLEQYLGAMGHMVVLRADSLDFIHAHALEETANADGKIHFETNLPEAGTYKLFAQFQHNGEVLTTDYVIAATGSAENSSDEVGETTGGHTLH